MLAMAAGVVGDVARQQINVASDEAEDFISGIQRMRQRFEQPYGGLPPRIVEQDIEQQFKALDKLFQTRQQVGQPHAGAGLKAVTAYSGNDLTALFQQDIEMACRLRRGQLALFKRTTMQIQKLGVLGQER